MTLRLNGTSSGFTEIDAPAAAGSNKITLPTSNGSAEQFLKNSGTAGELEFSSMIEDSSGRLMVGHSSSRDVANVAQPKIQIEGTNVSTSTLSVIRNSNDAGGPVLALSKTRGTSTGSSTVVQSGDTAGAIYFSGADGTDVNSYAAWIEAEIDGTPGGNDMPGRLVFSTTADGANSPSEHMRLDSSGRLLVNKTGSPSAGEGSEAPVFIQGNTTNASGPAVLGLARGQAASAMSSGASLGIITFTDEAGNDFAEIKGACDGSAGSDDHPGRLSFLTTPDASSSPTERLRIGNAGEATLRVDTYGLGVRSVAGSSSSNTAYFGAHSSTSISTGTITFEVYTNGNVKNTNNSYGQLSDQRLKENIIDAPSQWDDIKALQIRKYNFREGNGYDTHTQIGLVAQEVEAVSPGLVQETPVRGDATPVLDAEGNELEATKSVLTSVLYMKAVKALQEAQTRIETLETQNTAQQTQIDDLLARVTALEAA